MDETKADTATAAINRVLVIGSGPIVIGQAAEFDYAGTQACLALKEEGIHVILANNNPATIMTDQEIADTIYMEPLNVDVLTRIIAQERPEGLLATMGGQTGLNLAMELEEKGVLQAYGVRLLGTPIEAIRRGEDREAFKEMMTELGEPVPPGQTVSSVKEALAFAETIGYPVVVRPAYTLGGFGGGSANNQIELEQIAGQGLAASPIQQILVEQSILGWKEMEYEMMRDNQDTCIAVCSMENMDPVGTHTGDSIVVAPVQTLTEKQHHMLYVAACKVVREMEVIGGCNIQFALHPETGAYSIIEVNPRVSRSSALASKATGYPIARLATKMALGYRLDECINPITGHTSASFEPVLDYVVVKIPRWPFDKFPQGDRLLGTRMKATGEVMALGRNLETALNKGIRSLEQNCFSLLLASDQELTDDELQQRLSQPDDRRLFALGEAFRRGWTEERVQDVTGIDFYFLCKIRSMVQLEMDLMECTWGRVSRKLLRRAKEQGVADRVLARIFGIAESEVRLRWKQYGWKPAYKWVDTCAGEFEADTPYFYSSWQGKDEEKKSDERTRILVLGSGPIRIGQGIEFDYCSVHAAQSLNKLGYGSVVVNNNPETVSTDYATTDHLYFEPLTVEDVLWVAEKEKATRVMVQYGGQTAVKLTRELEAAGLDVLGTSGEQIDQVEDRHRFYEMLKVLNIPHIPGWRVTTLQEALQGAKELGYPLLVRPSYVIGGQGMQIIQNQEQLIRTLSGFSLSEGFPLLLDRFVEGMEVEVDAVTDGRDVVIPLLTQQIEPAGIHSGDSCSILGAPDLKGDQQQQLVSYTSRIAEYLGHAGLLNIQFVIQDNQVYVLEVNPRASRTVPVISKVTGVPMVEWATRVQLGESLASFAPTGLLSTLPRWAVKAPVFSATKLPGVDPAPGPEMKSTGEVLGTGITLEEAVAKVLPWMAGGKLPVLSPNTSLFFSVADSHKKLLRQWLPQLQQRGVQLAATPGTARYLRKWGSLPVQEYGHSDCEKWFQKSGPKILCNIPTGRGEQDTSGFRLRQYALQGQVPCFMSPDVFQWLLKTDHLRDSVGWSVIPLTIPDRLEAMKK